MFTAHPSEVRRQTLLLHLERITELLVELTDPLVTPSTYAATLDALRRRITLLWQTAEARTQRPSVLDEVESVVHFLTGTIYDVSAQVEQALGEAIAELADGAAGPAQTGDDAPALRFGSWVGSDRDGNPNVTAAVTRSAARLYRTAILRKYVEDVKRLERDFSISSRLVGALPELWASVERDQETLHIPAPARWREEPYRQKLSLMALRLERAIDGEAGAYQTAAEFKEDLDVLTDSLNLHHGGRLAGGGLGALRQRLRTFGFHLAELEIRQHADVHMRAAAELLALDGTSGYEHMSENERTATLEARLASEPADIPWAALSPATREVLDTFQAMRDIQTLEAHGCSTYIISMAREPSDVLAVLFLAQRAGLFRMAGSQAYCAFDAVPLFETIHELRQCGQVFTQMLASPVYRATLGGHGATASRS